MLLSAVCQSVTYIRPKSRTERPRKTKIGTEVAHITRDSDTNFTVNRFRINLQGRGGDIAAVSGTACFRLLRHYNNIRAMMMMMMMMNTRRQVRTN